MEEAQKNITSEHNDRKPMQDYISKINEILRELCKYSDGMSVDEDILRKRVFSRGFTEQELNETIAQYLNLNLIMKQGKTITIVE